MDTRTDYNDASTGWTCARKKAYPDPTFAARVAARVTARTDAVVIPYSCRRCGRYHIGHAPAETDPVTTMEAVTFGPFPTFDEAEAVRYRFGGKIKRRAAGFVVKTSIAVEAS